MTSKKLKFHENERVLCFHGPLLYEAKVLKTEIRDKLPRYSIHYNGWNKSWDEWVGEYRVLKYIPENLQKQKEIEKQYRGKNKKRLLKTGSEKGETGPLPPPSSAEAANGPPDEGARKGDHSVAAAAAAHGQSSATGASSTASSSVSGSSSARSSLPPTTTGTTAADRRKRGRTAGVETSHLEMAKTFSEKPEIKIRIPQNLKLWLVDDWDLVTRQSKLVQLPARITVEQILSDFVKSKSDTSAVSPPQLEVYKEITAGIKEYFNVMLGSQLLYKFERGQYSELLQKDKEQPMSQTYGSIHLLRLFVKLGSMLAYTSLDEKHTQTLLVHLHDFVKYLSKNSTTLFNQGDYFVPPPEYARRIY